ncbi:hypothetical protein MK489_20150 [Myxococcota bacterium]|nr:hypothetical protein [Myxococcota bacterium]
MSQTTVHRSRWPLLTCSLLTLQFAGALFFTLDRSPGTDAALVGFPLDDAWIHLVYAESLANFQGLSYNTAQPEAGFTSPLWVFLLAPMFWLGLGTDPALAVAVKLLGVLLAGACGWMTAQLVDRLTRCFPAAALAGAAVVTNPTFVFDSVSGMEVVLAATCLLIPILLLARGRPLWAAATLALPPLARPECGIVVLLALPLIASQLREEREPWLRCAVAFGPLLGAGTLWLGYCWAVTGHPLPTTFYVKGLGATGLPMAEALVWNARFAFSALGSLSLVGFGAGALLMILGARQLIRLGVDSEPASLRYASLLTLLAPLGLIAGILGTHSLGDPRYFYWSRYLHPVVPLLAVWLGLGAAPLLDPRGGRRTQRLALCLLLGAPIVLAIPSRAASLAATYAWNNQNMLEVQVRLGEWLRGHTNPSDRVATFDAGAVRFVGRRETLDLAGLNSHALLRDGPARIAEFGPDYLVAFPGDVDADWIRTWGLKERFRRSSAPYTIAPNNVQASMAIYEISQVPAPTAP